MYRPAAPPREDHPVSEAWIGAVDRPLEPLWRGLLGYRGLTLLSAIAVALYRLDDYAHPVGLLAVLGVMTAWTAATAYLYLVAPARRRAAVADLVVTVAVMATTPLVQTPAQIAADAPVVGSIWTPGAAVACALAFGVRGGLVGGLALAAADLAVSARVATELNDIELILLVGLTVGFASTVLRRSAERTRRAIASEAAMRERERLARAVHDGVLQVLGFVRRRGAELGGPAGELGALAGEQEYALRALLTTGPATADAEGRRDLAAALRVLGHVAGVGGDARASRRAARAHGRRAGRGGAGGAGQRRRARRGGRARLGAAGGRRRRRRDQRA